MVVMWASADRTQRGITHAGIAIAVFSTLISLGDATTREGWLTLVTASGMAIAVFGVLAIAERALSRSRRLPTGQMLAVVTAGMVMTFIGETRVAISNLQFLIGCLVVAFAVLFAFGSDAP
jgi:hypothetical protein